MELIKKIAVILTLVGALDWGLVGLFGFDLVAAIFGIGSLLSRIVYILVGASAVYSAVIWCRGCKVKDMVKK